jgi:hypothetical protein
VQKKKKKRREEKKIQLQLPHIKTVIKQKKLEVPENCRAKTFVLCGIAMGTVFSSPGKIGRQRKATLQKSIVLGNLWELYVFLQTDSRTETSMREADCRIAASRGSCRKDASAGLLTN